MLVRDLRQRLIGNLDVVVGGVGVRVSWPQHPRQRLAGVVQPGEQRVIAKPVLERRRRPLFLGMAGHQGGVYVDDQPRHHRAGTPHRRQGPAGLAAQQPGLFPRDRPSRLQLAEQRVVDRGQHPPRRRR
jgi:hypothetical protein